MLLNPYRFGSGSGPAPHRYWRCYVTAVGNMSQRILAIGWCGWYEHIGDADGVAISTGKTATCSNEIQALGFLYHASQPGISSNAQTFADNGLSASGPWWFTVDFTTPRLPLEIGFYPQPHTPENTDRAPVDLAIEWSDDGSTWTGHATIAGISEAWTIGTQYRFQF